MVGGPAGADGTRELLAVAVELATEAARVVAGMRESAITHVGTKSTVTDVVTAADTASERLIRDRLAVLRPGERVFGEELGDGTGAGGSHGPDGGPDGGPGTSHGLAGGPGRGGDDPGGSGGHDEVVWVVDPIDGTVNYLYGLPAYAVSIAATVGGVSVAGAIVEPATGRTWTAARGHGALVRSPSEPAGRRLRASSVTSLDRTLVGTGFSYDVRRRARQARLAAAFLTHGRDIRRSGSSVVDQCSVAAGWLDAYAEHGLNPWDWAAGSLVAQEAGAVVRVPGGPGSADDGLGDLTFAAAPGIADALLDVIRGVLADGDV